jgi:hypothetical protein
MDFGEFLLWSFIAYVALRVILGDDEQYRMRKY